jgi:GTPase SAR1 family protein
MMGYDSKKVAVVGHPRVGKTALVTQLVEKRFLEKYEATIEDNFNSMLTAGYETCDLDIADTSGDEQYAELRFNNFRASNGFLICFSIVDRNSFYSVRRYHTDILRAQAGELFTAAAAGRVNRSSTVAVSPPHQSHGNGVGHHNHKAGPTPLQVEDGTSGSAADLPLELSHVTLNTAPSASNLRLRCLSTTVGANGAPASELPLAALLVGLKADLFEERTVETDEAEALARDLGLRYVEVSARSHANTEECFKKLVLACRELNEPECICGAVRDAKHVKKGGPPPPRCTCHDPCATCHKRRWLHKSETHAFEEVTPDEPVSNGGCCAVQ